jgi:hypothetical protein
MTGFFDSKMKMKYHPANPKEEIPSQLQDPLERRRLQNRLSQRNHRMIAPESDRQNCYANKNQVAKSEIALQSSKSVLLPMSSEQRQP